jgi:hypothetical protein
VFLVSAQKAPYKVNGVMHPGAQPAAFAEQALARDLIPTKHELPAMPACPEGHHSRIDGDPGHPGRNIREQLGELSLCAARIGRRQHDGQGRRGKGAVRKGLQRPSHCAKVFQHTTTC